MLYAAITGPDTKKQSRVDWWVGRCSDEINNFAKYTDVVFANGDELLLILSNFDNIPLVRPDNAMSGVRWYGDMAKFIAGNLYEEMKVKK